MFDNIDNTPKPKNRDLASQEDKDINLLPEDFKHPSKHKPKDKHRFKLTRQELHPVAQRDKNHPEDKGYSKPKRLGSFLRHIFSLFNLKKKKVKPVPILSMNISQDKSAQAQPVVKAKDFSLEPKPEPSQQKSQPSLSEQAPSQDSKPDEKDRHLPREFKKEKETHEEEKAREFELDVNLLPKIKHRLTDKQIIISYVLIIIIGLLSIISPYVFYKSMNNKYQTESAQVKDQLTLIQQKNQEAQEQIREFGPLSFKLNHLLALLNNHAYWSKFFPTLERRTAKNVYFISLDVTSDKQIILKGKALKLRDIAEQLIVFQNSPSYSGIKLQDLSFTEADVLTNAQIDFSISFDLDSTAILTEVNQSAK